MPLDESNSATLGAWAASTFVLWGLLYPFYKSTKIFKEKAALAAFNTAHLMPILALCYYGLMRLDFVTQQPEQLDERMYGFDAAAEKICVIQMALQIYVTTAALATRDPSLLKPELLAHHSVTFILMWLCLHPFAHSRVGIFFGLTEISTVPLMTLDMFKQFKGLGERYPLCDMLSKLTFSLSFLVLRVVLTSVVSYEFQRDLYEIYTSGRAHSVPAVAFMSIANLFVCCLQFYWSTLIVKGVMKMVRGGGRGKKAA